MVARVDTPGSRDGRLPVDDPRVSATALPAGRTETSANLVGRDCHLLRRQWVGDEVAEIERPEEFLTVA